MPNSSKGKNARSVLRKKGSKQSSPHSLNACEVNLLKLDNLFIIWYNVGVKIPDGVIREKRSHNMNKIEEKQLSQEEIGEFLLAIAALVSFGGLTETEEKFIYENIYRDDDGVAWAYIDLDDRSKLKPIL